MHRYADCSVSLNNLADYVRDLPDDDLIFEQFAAIDRHGGDVWIPSAEGLNRVSRFGFYQGAVETEAELKDFFVRFLDVEMIAVFTGVIEELEME